jgi:syntaxin-binding protein 1
VQPAGKWKVLVVDSKSVKMLSASCKMFEITEENVTCTSLVLIAVVENIEVRRQPFPNLEAVYILTPTPTSVAAFIEDFQIQGNMYAAAHLFFTECNILW